MRNKSIIIAGLCFLFGLSYCKAQGLPQRKISITEFSSEDIPIRLSVDSLVRLYGMPQRTHKNHKNVYDSTGRKLCSYEFEDYLYSNWSLAYIVCQDSAELSRVAFLDNAIRIRFRDTYLDRTTTMDQINELLQVNYEDYYPMYDMGWLLGVCDTGFGLSYFGDEYPLLGSVDFYFDNNRKLIYIDFSCPPGSIVYRTRKKQYK